MAQAYADTTAMRSFIAIVAITLLSSCASAVKAKRNQIHPGMTKQEVIELLGQPDAIRGVPIRADTLGESLQWNSIYIIGQRGYCVYLVNGVVRSYEESTACN